MTHTHWMLRPLLITALVAALALGLRLWPSAPGVWEAWPRDGCQIVNCYCERLQAGLIVQPVTTYSNLAFVLIGLLVYYAPLTGNRFHTYQRVYGGALIAIGLGSFFYHASLTLLGEWFDLVGTYLLGTLLLISNLARYSAWPQGRAMAGVYLLLNAALGVQMAVARQLQTIVFLALFAGAAVLEALIWLRRRPTAQARWMLAGLVCFALGGVLWVIDQALPCYPDSWLQWHALWHVLAAVAAGLMFAYYRSER